MDTMEQKREALLTVAKAFLDRGVYSQYDQRSMDRLIQVVSAYGTPVIYCTREFAVRMNPSDRSDAMKEIIWNNVLTDEQKEQRKLTNMVRRWFKK